MTDAQKLLATRSIRGLADGVVSVALASYLTRIGQSPFQVGAIVTATLLKALYDIVLLLQFRSFVPREAGIT